MCNTFDKLTRCRVKTIGCVSAKCNHNAAPRSFRYREHLVRWFDRVRLTKVDHALCTYVLRTSISTYLCLALSVHGELLTRHSLHRGTLRDMKIARTVKRRGNSNWNSNSTRSRILPVTRRSQLVKALGNVDRICTASFWPCVARTIFFFFFFFPADDEMLECTHRSIDHSFFQLGTSRTRADLFSRQLRSFGQKGRLESEDDGFRRISRHRLECSAYSIRLASVT